MKNKNLKGLTEHSRLKKEENDICIDKAIEKLKRRGEPISFAAVAKESGISRTSLYADPKRRERIVGLRAITNEKAVREHNKKKEGTLDDALQKKIKGLRKEVKELKAENNAIAVQLVELEKLKDENRRLHDYIDRMHRE